MLSSAARTSPRSSALGRVSAISRHVRSESTTEAAGQPRSKRTMKEAFVSAGPKVTIRDVPIPEPGPGQVLIKVICSGSNPKDWKRPEMMPDKPPLNQGDDIAGLVDRIGPDVHASLSIGQSVAAFHRMMSPHGSYAEYAIAYADTTFPLPKAISFQEGATLPLAAMTAACGLYAKLRLPQPFLPATESIPLVIYGASSAVGSFAVQWAKRSSIHPLICVAGRAKDHVEKLIDRSRGDTIVDYRDGDEAVANGIRDALNGAKLEYAFDAVSEKGSYQNICKVLDPDSGHITFVLFGHDFAEVPPGIEKTFTRVGDVHGYPDDLKDFGFVYFGLISKALAEGWLQPHPHEVVPGGLEGVETGLRNLKEGRASAVKYVYNITETPGIETGAD